MTSTQIELVPAREPPHSAERLERRASAGELLVALEELERKNRSGERKLKLSMRVKIGGVFGGGGLFLLGAALALPVVQFGGFLVAVGAFFSSLLLSRQGRGLDLEDRKLDAARHVLTALGSELTPGAPVHLALDFEGYDRTAPLAGEQALSSGGDKLFEKRWLSLGFTLLDGTRVDVEATTRARRRSRRKTKYTKLKDRVSDDVVLTLRPPKGASVDGTAGEASVERWRKRVDAEVLDVRLSSEKARLRFRLGPGHRTRLRYGWHADKDLASLVDGRKLLDLILVSYAIARGDPGLLRAA